MTYIDSSIACIVAREFLEAIMFIYSYFGAVAKNMKMDETDRNEYYKYLVAGVLAGFLSGFFVSLGVGFGLKAAFESGGGLQAEIGMELGEGISKLIGFFFVTKMMFKIPKWFGISNFGRVPDEEYNRPNDPMGNSSADAALEAKETMAFSLFWNVFREMAETGCFVAIEGFLNPKAMATMGYSVLVGLVSAFGFYAIMGISAKFSSAVTIGITAAVIIEMLAVGLIAGAAHAFEEVHELRGKGETGYVWGDEDTDKDVSNTVKVFGFFGLRGKMSEVQFSVWFIMIILLTYLQISHNYYGNPLPSIKSCFCAPAQEVKEDKEQDPSELELELA